MRNFLAKYKGVCPHCEQDINVGDKVTYYKDDLFHNSCANEVRREDDKPLTHEQKTRPGYL